MYGSFASAGILTWLMLIVMNSARYKKASITSLIVDNLVVRDLKVEGKADFVSPHTEESSSEQTGVTEALQQLEKFKADVLKEIESLKKENKNIKKENKTLKDRLDNLKLNNLIDVDTDGRVEDGAFIGWADSEKFWVPYPEVGN